jgi:hypothetical protein
MITPAMWSQWCLSLPDRRAARNRLRQVRVLLAEVKGLRADTLGAVRRRVPTGSRPAEAAYSYQEYTRIRADAAAVFNTALVRIRANLEHLRRWHAGDFPDGGTEWLIGEALDCLARTGDVPRRGESSRNIPGRYLATLGGGSPEVTWGRLYLSRAEAAAAAVLLVASEAWNRSVLDRMRVPEHDPAVGDDIDIHTVEINKRRRPVRLRYTTANLVDAGPGSPGRLMAQVIEATEMARQILRLLGEPTERLLVWRRANRTAGPFGFGAPENQGSGKRRTGDLTAVSLRRLRRTVQVLVRREPAQNSQDTHDSVYVLRDPAARADAQQTIARGLGEAVTHARTIVKMRMVLGDDAGRLIELADDPELAKAIDNPQAGRCAARRAPVQRLRQPRRVPQLQLRPGQGPVSPAAARQFQAGPAACDRPVRPGVREHRPHGHPYHPPAPPRSPSLARRSPARSRPPRCGNGSGSASPPCRRSPAGTSAPGSR